MMADARELRDLAVRAAKRWPKGRDGHHLFRCRIPVGFSTWQEDAIRFG